MIRVVNKPTSLEVFHQGQQAVDGRTADTDLAEFLKRHPYGHVVEQDHGNRFLRLAVALRDRELESTGTDKVKAAPPNPGRQGTLAESNTRILDHAHVTQLGQTTLLLGIYMGQLLTLQNVKGQSETMAYV